MVAELAQVGCALLAGAFLVCVIVRYWCGKRRALRGLRQAREMLERARKEQNAS